MIPPRDGYSPLPSTPRWAHPLWTSPRWMGTWSERKTSGNPTGSEIVPVGTRLPMGKTYDSNGPQLSAQAVEAGCAVTASGPIPEDAEQLRGAIEAAQESSDILIRSG